MIYPTDDNNIKGDIDLICDNLFRIWKVQCSDKKTLKNALTEEITMFMKGAGYHKDCKIS